jgi:hypothetical protein
MQRQATKNSITDGSFDITTQAFIHDYEEEGGEGIPLMDTS